MARGGTTTEDRVGRIVVTTVGILAKVNVSCMQSSPFSSILGALLTYGAITSSLQDSKGIEPWLSSVLRQFNIIGPR